jgi:Helix-turn-helix domain
MSHPDELLTIDQAAAETGIPAASLHTLIQRGDLPTVLRIRRADLEDLQQRYDWPIEPM